MSISQRHARPCLEHLEDRCVPALILWTGFASGDWNDSGNWSLGRIPGQTDDVVIITGNLRSPMISSGVAEARSINADVLSLAGGVLWVKEHSKISTLSITGGTLKTDGLEVLALAWSSGTLAGSGQVNLTGTVKLSGNLSINGVEVVNDGIAAWGGGTIQLGHGGSFSNEGTLSVVASATMAGPLVNEGLIALAAGQTLTVAGDYSQSSGATLRVVVPMDGKASLLNVQETAAFGGMLDVRLTGQAPKVISTFPVVAMKSGSSSFATVSMTPVIGAKSSLVSTPQSVSVVVRPVLVNSIKDVTITPEIDPIPVPIPTPIPTPTPAPLPTPEPVPDQRARPDVSGGPSPDTATVQANGGMTSIIVAAESIPASAASVGYQQGSIDPGSVVVAGPSGKRLASTESGPVEGVEQPDKAEVVLDVVPVMPELPPLGGLNSAEMLASLLVGGPVRVGLVGKTLSTVAAVLPADDGPAQADRGDGNMSELFVGPVGRLGDWSSPLCEEAAVADVANDVFEDVPSMLSYLKDGAAPVALLGLAGAAMVAALHSRGSRQKRPRRAN